MQRSTIQLLRFHFSLFLLPVFLFAVSQVPSIDWSKAVVVFFILHLLVYPSSNGYNSYMDRDETPIGGLKNPMQPTKELYYVTVIMDVIAITISFFVSVYFALGIIAYIAASRLYSNRKIRLKKYGVIGFLTVFIFQGAVVFYISYHALHPSQTLDVPLLSCIISSLLIGALYPLTQIYQHSEDLKDGVTTISFMLGKRGTFLFSALLFVAATSGLYRLFFLQDRLKDFILFLVIMLPVVLFFLYWMIRVWQQAEAASFKNSFIMNLLSTICTTIFFILLSIKNH